MPRKLAPALGTLVALLAAPPAPAFEGLLVTGEEKRPVADAEVAVLGRAGSVRTDAQGRFRWSPDPRPPFEVLVVLPGGGYVKPILVRELPGNCQADGRNAG